MPEILLYRLNRNSTTNRLSLSGAVVSFTDPIDTNSSNAFTFFFSYLETFGISLENKVKLEQFLTDHSSLPNYLYQLSEVLTPFKGTSDFALKIAEFEEDDDSIRTNLILTIKTSLAVETAADLLGEIERSWLFQIQNPEMSSFSFALEFK